MKKQFIVAMCICFLFPVNSVFAGEIEEVRVVGHRTNYQSYVDPQVYEQQRKAQEEAARLAAETGRALAEKQKNEQREQTRKTCQAVAAATKTSCERDYSQAYRDELIHCGKVFYFQNLVEQCNLAAKAQLDADLLSCQLGYETTAPKC